MAEIFRFEYLTTNELDAFDRHKTFFILPIGLFEEHGPHLPIGTDILIASAIAENLAVRLKEKDYFEHIVLIKGVPFGAGGVRMPGTIEGSPKTIAGILNEFGQSLARDGFKYLFISNVHAGRYHMKAIEFSAAKLLAENDFHLLNISNSIIREVQNAELLKKIIIRLPGPLSSSQLFYLQSDGHAGWIETALMLWHFPELVKPVYKSLRFTEGIGREGFEGAPSEANAEFGRVATEQILIRTIELMQKYIDSVNA